MDLTYWKCLSWNGQVEQVLSSDCSSITACLQVNSAISLDAEGLSMGVFEQAVANIAYLRAQTGGGMSRLNFAAESLSSMETNMRAAIGRVEDVDIAAESANLAKYSILTQASAAMVAQANTNQRCGSDAPTIREELTCKRKSHR